MNLTKAVADRANVEIKYIGKVSNDKIDDRNCLMPEFEDLFFSEKNTRRKRRNSNTLRFFITYLESKDRIAEIAKDIVEHSITPIFKSTSRASYWQPF